MVNDIIEKMGIGILNYGRVEPDNLDGDLCIVSESDLDNFTELYKELCEALIDAMEYIETTNFKYDKYSRSANLFKKATGKSLDEIKELSK